MTPKEQKAAIRNERLALRDAMTPEARIEGSLAMVELAGDRIAFDPGTVISGFWPIRSEADIRPLMAHLRSRGARLCLPVVLDRETIVFRELVVGAPVVKTGFGTTGPGPEASVLDPDILLVPLSAFDRTGHRIGYGAGHYDRWLVAHPPRLAIGLAWDCQLVDDLPTEPHDVPLHAVVTPTRLYGPF